MKKKQNQSAESEKKSASIGFSGDKKDNVTVGEDTGKTAPQQAAEARGEKDEAKEDNTVDQKALKIVAENLSPEQKRSDAVNEARHEHYKRIGTDYIKGEIGGGKGKKDGATWKMGEVKEPKKYAGHLTVTGVSGEDGREISAPINIPEEQPVTEEGVFYRFKANHRSAMREGMKIDPSNTDDPLLSTSKG